MKKIFLITLLAFLITACKKDITSINVDPKNPQEAPASAFITSAQKNLTDLLTSANVGTNIFRLIMQYWQQTTYTDESNYNIGTRQVPRQVWDGLYRDVIRDIRETKRLIPAPQVPAVDANVQKNQLAVAEILEIYAWYYLITTFGNIPYSQALNVNNTQPKYDDQKTIYYDLLDRLDAAIHNLNPAVGSFGNADNLYGGNVAAWKKFGNTFKLKMAMTIADVDNAKAKALTEAAVTDGIFTSNKDNAVFRYLAAPPNTNPVWVDLVQNGRKDFVAASTIIEKMKTLKDPRLDNYFTTDPNNGYSGGIPGTTNNYAAFSKPGETITAPDFPASLLSYAEAEFYLAEAVERGYNVGGTSQQHYNNAVTASIVSWGGTEAEANTYLALNTVNYTTAAGSYKQKIGEQKWIALYNRGWDAWIEWRRFDYPKLIAPVTALSATPLRYTYPVSEQNLNTANYNAAAAAIGGDAVTTKLFWDKP